MSSYVERVKVDGGTFWEVRAANDKPVMFSTEKEAWRYLSKMTICPCCGQTMPKKIRMGAKYRTRCGEDVRLYAVEEKGNFPVHGAMFTDHQWKVWEWKVDGKASDSSRDLIEIEGLPTPERNEGDGL